jgi:hypothetical protein
MLWIKIYSGGTATNAMCESDGIHTQTKEKKTSLRQLEILF